MNVWYASYGSNLLRRRFMTYIQGGTPEGAAEGQVGCTDPTPPLDDRPVRIPHRLFFAGRSVKWENGGVAFIEGSSPDAGGRGPEPEEHVRGIGERRREADRNGPGIGGRRTQNDGSKPTIGGNRTQTDGSKPTIGGNRTQTDGIPESTTLGRMYLISPDQFREVFLQENGHTDFRRGALLDQLDPGLPNLDSALRAAEDRGRAVAGHGLYALLLFLGRTDGMPVFSFTTSLAGEELGLNPPGPAYRRTIIRGLEESHGLSRSEAEAYLESAGAPEGG